MAACGFTAATSADIRAFYLAALAGLRFVEARRPSGRRFGKEADARWNSFRGDLQTADRIDLFLRDADAEWPGAFAARGVFAESGVAEDEAFGARWVGLDPVDAEDVWRSAFERAETRDLKALLSAWGAAWDCKLSKIELKPVSTAARFVIAGPSAIASILRAFVGRDDLAWSDQVTIVATPPAHRQLAGLSTAVLNATKATVVLIPEKARSLVGRPIVSDDAAPEDAAVARKASR